MLNSYVEDAGFPARKFYAVDRNLINDRNDRILFDLSRRAIIALAEKLPGSRFLFWDLAIREYENRTAGRYFDGAGYRHPVWNLQDVLAEFGENAVDCRDILDSGARLYIDSSGHPSLLGWIYILRSVLGRGFDLHDLDNFFDKKIVEALSDIFGCKKVLITGDSKFFRLLDRYVKLGLLKLPKECVLMPLGGAVKASGFDKCLYFPAVVTHQMSIAEIDVSVDEVRRNKASLEQAHHDVSVLFYGNWASECISIRTDFLNMYVCPHPQGQTEALESAVCSAGQGYKISDSRNFEGLIELSNTLLPTARGFFEILGRAINGADDVEIAKVYEKMTQEVFDF